MAVVFNMDADLLSDGCCMLYISGQCYHCGEKVTGANEACQAMGNLYHTNCFVCCSCGKFSQ